MSNGELRKPKVLYVITRAVHGGAQTHVFDLIKELRNTMDVALAAGERGFLTDEAERIGVKVHILKKLEKQIAPLKDFLAVLELCQLLREVKPDLVHLHSSKAGVIGRIACFLSRIPCVFTAHGWAFAAGVPWTRKVIAVVTERMLARFTSHIVTVSVQDKKLALANRVGVPDQLHVIHNAIPDCSSKSVASKVGAANIVMVARFDSQKDHLLLLRALAEIEDEYSLTLVGDGPGLAAAKVVALELKIGDKVVFFGARSDVPEILEASDIFVLASNWEGFPISILEGMRAGLPIVSSKVGGVAEAVIHGETGFLVERGNVSTLRQHLQMLIRDPELRTKMGQAGRLHFEQNFRIEKMIEETLQVYKYAGLVSGSMMCGKS